MMAIKIFFSRDYGGKEIKVITRKQHQLECIATLMSDVTVIGDQKISGQALCPPVKAVTTSSPARNCSMLKGS